MKTQADRLLDAAYLNHVKHGGHRGMNYVACAKCDKHYTAHFGRDCLYLRNDRNTVLDSVPLVALDDKRLK